MRNSLQIVINGQRHIVDGKDAFLTLSTYLRESLGLVGTKIVCSEGDCGACSVLVGRISNDGKHLKYKAIDSCIAFLYQLDQTHIVTIEGLGDEKQLSIVQEFLLFITESKKWWLIPILLVLGLVGLLVVLGSTGAAPFIYTLF